MYDNSPDGDKKTPWTIQRKVSSFRMPSLRALKAFPWEWLSLYMPMATKPEDFLVTFGHWMNEIYL